MKRPATALALAIAAALVLCCGPLVLPVLMGGGLAEASCVGGGGLAPLPAASAGPVSRWNGDQLANAAAIVATGRRMGVPPRGLVIALATAMQESTLRNLANTSVPESLSLPHQGVGSDHDSVGLFQQRPSAGWGTVPQLMTPSYSATKFYERLLRVDGWERMRLTDAAQAVQRSGFPEAYQRWEADAEALAAHLLGIPNIDQVGGGDPSAPCGVGDLGPVIVGPGGWVQPVRAAVGSGFRTPDRPNHQGVDLSAPRHTAIRAASTGVVVTVRCNSGSGTCDRDGGPSVGGCGWYVEIQHAQNIVTRYCHMVQRPEVSVGQPAQAGQIIGFVGSSGNSSGPHLHYEVHYPVPAGGQASSANAIDPVGFMRQVRAPLGS